MVSSDMRPDASAPIDVSLSDGDASNASVADPGLKKVRNKKSLTATKASRPSNQNVGNVLRSVYQTAVQEEIPSEMLDLLNKLD